MKKTIIAALSAVFLVASIGHEVIAATRQTSAAQLPAAAIATSIEQLGGYVVRDAKGQIIEVSLARTWATDADVERIAGIKTLKKLDLSLTYISDAGAESLARLTQLEELNLFTAEFI